MINKVILIGNVGKDPEIRYVSEGVATTTISLAVSEPYRDKQGNRQTHTEWIRVALWRNLAEVAEKYVKKGTQLYIEGRLSTRNYTDKEGREHTVTEVVASDLKLLGAKPQNGPEVPNTNNNQEEYPF